MLGVTNGQTTECAVVPGLLARRGPPRTPTPTTCDHANSGRVRTDRRPGQSQPVAAGQGNCGVGPGEQRTVYSGSGAKIGAVGLDEKADFDNYTVYDPGKMHLSQMTIGKYNINWVG